MRSGRARSIVLLAAAVIAVLCSAALADASCLLRPPPSCGPAGLTGRDGTSYRCGHRPPPICHSQRGPRGEQGAAGKPGQAGPRGSDGSPGAEGPTGLRGIQGETGSAGPAGPAGSEGAAGPQGLEGVRGEVGAAGATGPTGPQGETGPSGAPGAQGGEGPPGEVGPAGPEGPAGPPGPPGDAGQDGAPGIEGTQGPAGPAGATGATGPPGSNGLSQYAYIYNLGLETVALEADITFDSNGVMTPGISHAPGNAGIGIVEAGTYEVTFSVSGTEPNQIAIFLDGTLVPGTIYGSGAGTQQNTGQAIVVVPAGAVLSIRNHTSSAAIGLAAPIGGTGASSNASVVIEKLA
jgi:hypothetical protein